MNTPTLIIKDREELNIKKIGHAGTLDPLATGVLPVLVGRSAKAAEYLLSENKKYIAEIQLGITTDTCDITGEVLQQSHQIPHVPRYQESDRDM